MIRRFTAARSLVALPLAALVAAGCARNPVTGKRELALVSKDQEIALGKESAEQVKQQMGVYPDEKVQAYVREIGMRIAKASERPDLPWQFTVLDDPTVNAFALPGGPVFITRGILTYLGSEAELASVLGHEIGHITARHSVEQLSKQQLAQLGLGVGMIVSPELAQLGQAAVAGLQLLFLKYGRDAERQADQLGFKYMAQQGYDVREMSKVFVTLERSSVQQGAGRVPEWQSTHPDPGNRAEVARERAAKATIPPGAKVEHDRYVGMVSGMVFGDDPRQGFFKGDTFLHPELKFQMKFPQGWKAQNTPTAVVAVSPKQDAALQLAAAGKLSPEEATKKFFAQEGVKPLQAPQTGTVGGQPATASYFQAQTDKGVLNGLVSFISHGGVTYQLVGYSPAQAFSGYDGTFKQAIASFGPLTDKSAENIQPAKIEVVRVPREMTVSEFNQQFPSTVPLDVVAIVNGVDKDGKLAGGAAAKRITGGVPAKLLQQQPGS
ncbi:M48 family metalloprotease [Anaeromyxobacter terrae]|uniref:M48 family metalloprotease n=1 Tax=Anaeromyxobacter terrae TaxID=2925406 RepID=UPI001F59A958|nr:M48 family metalloprotease [Anaeromyxobacter sp. SG22]